MENDKSFEVYKGLQKPLVFKTYKGRFIYWMAGGLFASFILCVLLCVLIGYVAGGIALFAGATAVVTFVNTKQKGGVHSKTKTKGVVFIRPSFNRFGSKKQE